MPSNNKAISAVVSLAGDDDDFFLADLRKPAQDILNNLKASIFHQDRTQNPDLLDSLPVDLFHLP
jgi:hypothetical protein